MASTKLQQFLVHFDSSEEFHRLKQEVFTRNLYYFDRDDESRAPRIIDAGAHIGLATLYFKKQFPAAHIITIEPLAANLKLLEENIWENRLENVDVYPIALADQAGPRSFFHDKTDDHWFSTAGFSEGAWNHEQKSDVTVVETKPLSDFLDQPIDFLKMDIEGAEYEVLYSTGEQLTAINHMMVELHPHPEFAVTKLVEYLEQLGFEISIWKNDRIIKPSQARGLVILEAKLNAKKQPN